jgi:hypothetical protein
MSRDRNKRAEQPSSRDPKGSAPRENPPIPDNTPPLKPHPKLFLTLLLIFLVWVGFLLGMYFTTVYPQRHPSAGAAPASRPGASDLPSAPR